MAPPKVSLRPQYWHYRAYSKYQPRWQCLTTFHASMKVGIEQVGGGELCVTNRPQMKRIACVTCRQAKLKCEILETEPKCLRCKQKSLDCVADSEYKRVNKRSRLEDLSAEVKRLKSLLAQTSVGPDELQHSNFAMHDGHTSASPSSLARTHQNEGDSGQVNTQISSVLASTVPSDTNAPKDISTAVSRPARHSNSGRLWYFTSTSRELDDVCVSAEHITNLFQLFFGHFHPHLSILDDKLSPDDFYDRSILLFWTIVTVASGAYTEDVSIYSSLTKPLTKMLWSKVSGIPQSHFTIQATIILCMWPFRAPTMIADPTLMLISIARTGCMQIGLHRPEAMQDYNRIRFQVQPAQIAEAVKLWVGCFITAESVTSSEGHEPLFMATDSTLRRACKEQNPYNLPGALWRALNVQMFLNRFFINMASMTCAHQERESQYEIGTLLSSFEDEVDKLDESLRNHAGDAPSPWLLFAKLHVQMYYFLEPLESPLRRSGLLRAYHTAIDLIKQFHGANVAVHFGHSCPRYFGQMLKYAALTIMKLTHSCYSHIISVEESKHFFDTALSIHRSMSVGSNDFNARASILLSHSWTILKNSATGNDGEPVLSLKTRHGASLLYECLWMWRDYFATTRDDPLLRPPRTLPSIVQHSSSASINPASSSSEIGRENPDGSSQSLGAGNLHVANGGHFSTDWTNSDAANTEANNTELAAPTQEIENMFPPDIFEMMNTYFGPDLEASGLFFQ